MNHKQIILLVQVQVTMHYQHQLEKEYGTRVLHISTSKSLCQHDHQVIFQA
jgi:hypothetical protein